jgi:dipeptidyl aminopeptidase/acylaminoacyl peptidase
MHDLTLAAVSKNHLIVSRTDMNHAPEIFKIDLMQKKYPLSQITNANKSIYDGITLSNIESRMIEATDGSQILTWIIYPPGFDAAKKYPAILYCQGGPQSAVSQFYSYRWNFQLMAAHGYVVIAPNRRGLPGFGTQWNEAISQDWGGQAIRDYLSASDSISKLPFIDKSRIAAVGPSFGGYSVYMLAGVHDNRFRTFISHAGVFNLKSMYNSTEEIWFTNWDLGGSWWQNPMPDTYSNGDPMNFIYRWNTPMLITTGEKDYRIPYTQSMEAFQILQLKNIKSRLIIFPDENHWILKHQNSLLFHREFYRWLKETMPE